MIMKWTVVYLVTVAMLGQLCNAQYPAKYNPQQPKYSPSVPDTKFPDTKFLDNLVQSKDQPEPPIQWEFPLGPIIDPLPLGPPVLRTHVPVVTVAVECRERDARVEVKRDMFGTGQLVNPGDLTLGSCLAVGEDSAAQVLIFESNLHECDSRLMVGPSQL